jgi:DNA polymerase III epsilon subunit-like protein
MFQKLFENWRSFQKILNEDVMTSQEYGGSFSEMRKLIESARHRTWIFFDTETTGLNPEKDYHQITQIAAIAVDVKNFDEPPVILEKFNVKIKLNNRTRGFMNWEKRKGKERVQAARASGVEVAPGVKRVRPEKNKFQTIPGIFGMTGYGVSRDEEKARRKAFLSAPEGTKLKDVPPSPPFLNSVRAAESFINFLDKYQERALVAQNAPFDVKFINEMYNRIGEPPPNDIVVDTVVIFRKFLVPALKKFQANKKDGHELDPVDARILAATTSDKGRLTVSLGKLIKAFDIENKGWHDALADVTMLLEVLKAVINFLDSREDLSSLTPEPDFVKPQIGEGHPKPSDI